MANATNCSPASTSGMRSKSRLSRLNLGSKAKLRSTAQRIDSRMHLGAIAPFVATALASVAVQDDRAKLALADLGRTDDGAHLKTSNCTQVTPL